MEGPRESWGTEASYRSSGHGRTAAWATAVVALVVGLLVVTSPAAAMSPPAKSSKTLTAPYSGAPAVFGLFDAVGCAFTETTPVAANFNLTTGDAVASANLSQRSCGQPVTSAEVDWTSGVNLNTTFTAASTGSFKVSVTWSFDYQVYLTAKETKKGESSSAEAEVGGSADLSNKVNASSFTIGYNDSVFVNGSSATTHSYKYSVTYSATLPLTKGVVYYVTTGVVVLLLISVGSTGGSAVASVNMGSSPYKAVLSSVVQP
jgi:hypothetical protein